MDRSYEHPDEVSREFGSVCDLVKVKIYKPVMAGIALQMDPLALNLDGDRLFLELQQNVDTG